MRAELAHPGTGARDRRARRPARRRLRHGRAVRHRRAAPGRLRRAEPLHLLSRRSAAPCRSPRRPVAVCRPIRRHGARSAQVVALPGRDGPDSAYNLAGGAPGGPRPRAPRHDNESPGNRMASMTDPAPSTPRPARRRPLAAVLGRRRARSRPRRRGAVAARALRRGARLRRDLPRGARARRLGALPGRADARAAAAERVALGDRRRAVQTNPTVGLELRQQHATASRSTAASRSSTAPTTRPSPRRSARSTSSLRRPRQPPSRT